jgi:VanZ family protein
VKSLPRNPKIWLAGFILWLVILFVLSSFTLKGPDLPKIPNIDKVEHFGYFFGGGGLLGAYLFRRQPERPNWKALIGITIGILALVGISDEIHQSFTPGRSGNDPYDWMADVLGATAGALTLKRIHHWLK